MPFEWLYCPFLLTHLPFLATDGHNNAIVIIGNHVIKQKYQELLLPQRYLTL